MNSKRLLTIAISALILIALVAPTFSVGAQDGKVLRAVLSQGDVRSLDPNIATDNISNQSTLR